MKYIICLLMTMLFCSCDGVDGLFVAPNGSDNNPGTKELPLKTVERARDLIREARANGSVTIPLHVYLRGGEYAVKETIEFTESDSGSVGAPVVFSAYPGEDVKLIGAKLLDATCFSKISDSQVLSCVRDAARPHLLELDLNAMKVQHARRWPDLVREGGLDLFEIYFNGKRLPLARYPNVGFMNMKEVVEVGSKGLPGIFKYSDGRHADWESAVKRGLWLKGFWRVPWQSEYVRIKEIDTDKGLVYHSQYVSGGIGSKYHRPKGSGKEPYIALNLIEEIDQPGEWCIDFDRAKLYLWPPSAPAAARIMLADKSEPMVRLKNAKHITLKGFLFEGCLGNAVEVHGGEYVAVTQCTVRNIGRDAVVINGGLNHRVDGCEIYDVGAQGVFATGGNRAKLKPAGHVIENNHIYRFARTKTIYAAGINLGYGSSYGVNPDSVGITVRNNLIHDTPHVGVLYGGNNHLLEYNEIHHVALVSNDMGGFYTVNDWTTRGNVIRYNFVHSSPQAEGVYCDDGDSGDIIYGNIFYQLHNGVFIGGGHDNIVSNNVAVSCDHGYHVDSRGVSRGYDLTNRTKVGRVKSVDYRNPPWSTAYPEMVNILELNPQLPTGSSFKNNRAVNCENTLNIKGAEEHFKFCAFEDNEAVKIGGLGGVDLVREYVRNNTDLPIEGVGLNR